MSKKKNTTTPTPHDAAFRSFLANPDVARDFLELHLPAEYRQLCDLSTLKLEPATFVAYFHERRSLNNFHRDRVITFEQIAE